MMATGTSHSCRLPSVKPLSSRGLSRAGIMGSVAAPASMATTASTQVQRRPPKYGARRCRRCRRLKGGAGTGPGASLGGVVACM
ncbi:hypothetical protein D3C78_1369420 [compost metagenome]